MPPDRRQQFSLAQAAWGQLSTSPGLVAQFGGWDLKNPGTAMIAAFWESAEAYRHFMDHVHDRVTESNRQEETYSSIDVDFFVPRLAMPGVYSDWREAWPHAGFMRVADCTVRAGAESRFEQVQEEVWIPAMSRAEGMLGGVFSRHRENPQRYLVTTLWKDETSHSRYTLEDVPRLREQAGASHDLERLVGRFVELVPAWKVAGLGSVGENTR